MSPDAAAALATPAFLQALHEICDLAPPPALDNFTSGYARRTLADVELLVTGWGCPPIDACTLDSAPRLRAIVHTAGSIRGHVTPACWERGIEVSSAASLNALPVAEYTLAMILLGGKHVLERARGYRLTRDPGNWLHTPAHVGNYGKTVGILSASLTGRRVAELLRPFDFQVLLYDPFLSESDATAMGVRAVGLAELFAHSDIVSIHTPLLPETQGLVSRQLLASMRPHSLLINTSRGAIVDQEALTEALCEGRIRAVLDVTEPEVLPPGHPLWTCDDVLMTPHLAGSQGNEWNRLTASAIAEIRRWIAGGAFAYPVRKERLAFLA
jgi:phosphoglycerate dehydrogenase-like enzyme